MKIFDIGGEGLTFASLRGQRCDVNGGQRSVIGLNRWQLDFRNSRHSFVNLQQDKKHFI